VAVVLVGFIAAEILGLIAQVVVSQGAPQSLTQLAASTEPPWWFVLAGLVGLWAGFIGTGVVAQRRGLWTFPENLYGVRWRDLKWVGVGVLLQVGVDWSYAPFHPRNMNGPATKLLGSTHSWTIWLLGAATVIGAPIAEELFFRATLFGGLAATFSRALPRIGLLLAGGLSAVLFGLAHAEGLQLPGLIGVGLILAWIYQRTNRLAPSVLAHAGFNGAAFAAYLVSGHH
jgi:membrane protease YdiL (CAAX protease family)